MVADFDSGIVQGEGQPVQQTREGRGIGGCAGGDEEIGGGTDPGVGAREEVEDRLDERVRGWRLVDGVADRGVERRGPGDGGDVACGGRGGLRLHGETFRERAAEGAEDFRKLALDELVEHGLGEACAGGQGREIDEEGAGGDLGREVAGFGDGEDDGAADPMLYGLGVAGFAEGEAGTGGDAAEGIGDGGR